MKDEDIKLPDVSTKMFSPAFRDALKEYARTAVRLNVLDVKPPQRTHFDLEEAKAGKPLVTRDGRTALFVACVDKAPGNPVVAWVEGEGVPYVYSKSGRWSGASDCIVDLFMAPKPKRTVWVSVYDKQIIHRDGLEACAWNNEEDATRDSYTNVIPVIKTVPVEIDA